MPAIVLGAVAVNVGLKIAVGRARPPDPLTDTALASFPSGHVLHAVVLVGLAPVVGNLLTRRRWVAWLGIAVAAFLVVVVALLRVHLGAHWPTDVTASMRCHPCRGVADRP